MKQYPVESSVVAATQLNQSSVDDIHDSIKTILSTEINKLPNITAASSKQGRRSLSKSATFWNADLQQAWFHRWAEIIFGRKLSQHLKVDFF